MRLLCHFIFAIALSIAALFYGGVAANCTELLINGSFENPVVLTNGDHFFGTNDVPSWSVVADPPRSDPVNLVRPFSGYGNNPHATPTGGGSQYLDINSAGGVASQTIVVPSDGVASISAWFSVREGSRNLLGGPLGGTVRLRNSSNVIVASGVVNFVLADSIQTWKKASTSFFAVPAGTYRFEVVMDNYHNIDLASLDFVANYALDIDKSANSAGPLVVGQVVTYTYIVKNTGNLVLNNVNVADVHGGTGSPPVPGLEVLVTDAAPTGDTSDPTGANGNWDTLGPGDTVRFTATYTVTQADIDTLQ